jgi:bifunctional DNA-binding transcriptional regulator/antitoxin component of YhaV-PrlF toxin-antitoxin module
MQEENGVVMDKSGRLRLPAKLRRQLGYRGPTRLYPIVTRDGVLLRTRDDAWRAAQGVFAHLGGRGSVVDELIAERRAEQAGEDAG